MNTEKTCQACNGYGIDPRCPICNQAKQSAFLRDVGVFKPIPITERNTAVLPEPTFADGMTAEDDNAFNRQWDAARFCKNCHGQTGGEVDICEGPHVVDRRWVDCRACGGTGLAPSNAK